jgi:copper chaperone CopZ
MHMNRYLFLLIPVVIFQACQGDAGSRHEDQSAGKPAVVIASENLGTMNFDVEGMTCEGCEKAVERSVEGLKGIAGVKASHTTGETTIRYDKTVVDEDQLRAGIEAAGYRVKGSGRAE